MHGQRAAACIVDRVRGLVGRGQIDIGHRNAHSLSGQRTRNRAAQATAGAEYERHLASQL
ncbi:hypothetical protein PBS_56720 [Paraburkholderia sp. 2C]